MCLMLYIGTDTPLPTGGSPDLRLEPVEAARQRVGQWFSYPAVRFVAAHTGCSCGFPSVMGDSPVTWYPGMPLQSDDRAADLRSVRALLGLLATVVTPASPVELYPVADGDEGKAPMGTIDWQLDLLDAERFFFNEGFMHRVSRDGSRR